MAVAKGYYKNLVFHHDFMPEVRVSQEIMNADILISLPKFKPHGLTVMTGAIKTSYDYGILSGAQKARSQRIAGMAEHFQEVIVEVFYLRGPDFFIMELPKGDCSIITKAFTFANGMGRSMEIAERTQHRYQGVRPHLDEKWCRL